MSLPCFYSVSAINYKNQFCSVCPRQSDHLSYEYLPTKIFNDSGFVNLRNKLQQGVWPSGCDLCEEMEGSMTRELSDEEISNRIYYRGRFASSRNQTNDAAQMIFNWEETSLK